MLWFIINLTAWWFVVYDFSLESVDSLFDEKIKFEKVALDLPYYAKYFLIAAYIASFNSPKYDRQLFVKASNKKKKSINKTPKKTENSTSELVGPKIFSLDRLLAIFYAIIEENTNMTANLLAQVIIYFHKKNCNFV